MQQIADWLKTLGMSEYQIKIERSLSFARRSPYASCP